MAASEPEPMVTYGSLSVEPWGWMVNRCAPVASTPPNTSAAPIPPWYLMCTLARAPSERVRKDVLEEPLFEHGHSCDNTGLAAR